MNLHAGVAADARVSLEFFGFANLQTDPFYNGKVHYKWKVL